MLQYAGQRLSKRQHTLRVFEDLKPGAGSLLPAGKLQPGPERDSSPDHPVGRELPDSGRRMLPARLRAGSGKSLSGGRLKRASADGEAIPEEFREARNKGLYYLQFSGKTENEMRKKLAEQEFSPASVEDAILFLKHYRYLDDEDYARRYVEKNGHKKSIRQMKFDLRQKGVSDDLVEMIFEDMEVDESAQILGLLRKKNYDPEEPDPAKRQKIYAFLARKGFSYDAINSAMKQWE